MKTTRLKLATAALLSAVMVTAACGRIGAGADEGSLRFAHVFGPNIPINACGAEPMSADDALADVGLDMTVLPSGQLGSEHEIMRQVAGGDLDMTFTSGGVLAEYYGDMEVFESYYLYDDLENAYEIANGEIAQGLFDELLDVSGMRRIGVWLYGERHLLGNRAVRTPDDLDGFLFRIPESPVSIAGAESMGGRPTPVAYSEIYTSLEQGVIDGFEAPASILAAEGFDEPGSASHFNLTGHLITVVAVLINENSWNALTDEQRNVLEERIAHYAGEIEACVAEQDQETFDRWESTGQVEIVDDVDRDAFAAMSREYFSDGFEWSELYVQLREEHGR